jgi:hypothetical protein
MYTRLRDWDIHIVSAEGPIVTLGVAVAQKD